MEDEEYTAQCVGGPDDGNLVTATVPKWELVVTYQRHLDGHEVVPMDVQIIRGEYVWTTTEHGPVFEWRP